MKMKSCLSGSRAIRWLASVRGVGGRAKVSSVRKLNLFSSAGPWVGLFEYCHIHGNHHCLHDCQRRRSCAPRPLMKLKGSVNWDSWTSFLKLHMVGSASGHSESTSWPVWKDGIILCMLQKERTFEVLVINHYSRSSRPFDSEHIRMSEHHSYVLFSRNRNLFNVNRCIFHSTDLRV